VGKAAVEVSSPPMIVWSVVAVVGSNAQPARRRAGRRMC